jgi:glycerophosphoryl diester phosphodiesterase
LQHIEDGIEAVEAAGKNAYLPVGQFNRNTTPLIIPHDNAGAVNPKDTIEGARALIASGWTGLLDWNVQMAGDGTLFCLHDATLAPQTDGTGNGYDQTAASLAVLNVDAGPSPWPTTGIRVPTVAQVLQAFPNQIHHFEIKSGAAYGQTSRFAYGDTARALVALLQRYNRTQSVLVSSFTDAELQVVRQAGIETMLIMPVNGWPTDYTGATMTAASLYASGTRIINPDGTRTTYAADVAAWKALGFKVVVGTIDRRSDLATYVTAVGADGYVSNNPFYVGRATQARKVDLWKSGARTDGLIGYDSTHQGVVTGGGLRIATTGTLYVLAGDISYGESSIPTTYSINFSVKCNAVGNDLTRHWDMFVCSPTDTKYQAVNAATENGYLLFHKPNGAGNIQTETGGVNGAASGGTISSWTTGDDLAYRLDVTPTTIKLTLLTLNGTTKNEVLFNFSTTAWRGGYFFLGRNDGGGAGSGLDVTFHDVSVT